MKKLLALALLVSFAGVHAADAGGDSLGGDKDLQGESQPSATQSLQERFKNHPWAALGGGASAAVLALIAGARDPQSVGTAVVAGAAYGIGSKEVLDRSIPQLPDDKFSNMGKGAVGPIGVKFFPNVLNLGTQGTRSIQGR